MDGVNGFEDPGSHTPSDRPEREGSMTPQLWSLNQSDRLECGPSGNTVCDTLLHCHPLFSPCWPKRLKRDFLWGVWRRSAIEIILTGGILVWFGNITAHGHKVIKKTGKTSSKITGSPLPRLTDISTSCRRNKVLDILKDPNHPADSLQSTFNVYNNIWYWACYHVYLKYFSILKVISALGSPFCFTCILFSVLHLLVFS